MTRASRLLVAAMALWLVRCGSDGGGSGADTAVDEVDEGDDAVEDVVDEQDDADGLDAPVDVQMDEIEEIVEEPDPEWERFLAAREGYLAMLSEPILACVALEDTEHPAFHGCIDWHSAVEGAWALHVLARVLGDAAFTEALAAMLTPADVAAELELMQSGGPLPSEVPYGYSWFLALAVERERAGLTDLQPLADVATAELVNHLTGLTRSQIDGALRSGDYTNLSWIVLNVHAHATFTGDDALAVQMEDFTRTEILPRESLCPLSRTPYDVDEFFAPCMHRARLLVSVLDPDEAAAWAEYGVPDAFSLEPLLEAPLPHVAGLNFSRAWDLLDLYRVTGDRSYRYLYVEHVEAHLAMPQYWRDDYLFYAHWVPQFGVYAIARSYE